MKLVQSLLYKHEDEFNPSRTHTKEDMALPACNSRGGEAELGLLVLNGYLIYLKQRALGSATDCQKIMWRSIEEDKNVNVWLSHVHIHVNIFIIDKYHELWKDFWPSFCT